MKKQLRGVSAFVALAALGFASLGGDCGGGKPPDSPKPGGGGGGGGGGGSVGATCNDVCACLSSACPDFPFAPDCMTACTAEPTNVYAAWDLGCRAKECAAAKTDHDTHCPNASGVTVCK